MADKQNNHPLMWLGVTAVVLAVGGIAYRVYAAHELLNRTDAAAMPVVNITHPKQGPATEELVLPGNVQAWHEAPIFARTNGYLKDWKVDIGTEVSASAVLADIDTPEVDAQLRQAEADVKTAQANNDVAQVTAARYKVLLQTDSVAKEDADEKIATAAADAAALSSARANRDHLRDLENFKYVVAPFEGRVTARNVDTGALISAASGQEMFHLVDSRQLRIYVQVPQNQAGGLTPSMTAVLKFTDHPGKTYTATLLNTAQAIDPNTRTLLAQFVADNASGELLAGGYAEVHIKLAADANAMRLPVNTLVFRAAGLQVATVDASDHAHLQSVTMGRDFGNEVEIAMGLTAQDRVIINPPDALINGQQVSVTVPKATSSTQPSSTQPEVMSSSPTLPMSSTTP